MAQKFRVGLALQPLATALFANSPFTEGKPNGYPLLSQPHLVRHRPAPHRHAAVRVRRRVRLRALCRLHARRADVLRVPRRPLHRRRRPVLPRLHGRQAAGAARRTAAHVATGPTTSPPPSPKSGSRASSRCAAPTAARGTGSARCPRFWVGLLYDQAALDAAWDLVKGWDMAGREALRNAVPKLALDAPLPGGGTLRDIAGEVLAIARAGLAARGAAQRQRRQRDRLPRPARRDRAQRQGPGAAAARPVQRRMGRRHHAGLRRELLMRDRDRHVPLPPDRGRGAARDARMIEASAPSGLHRLRLCRGRARTRPDPGQRAWESRAALDAHFAAPHMAEWRRERDALGHDRSRSGAQRRTKPVRADEVEVRSCELGFRRRLPSLPIPPPDTAGASASRCTARP